MQMNSKDTLKDSKNHTDTMKDSSDTLTMQTIWISLLLKILYSIQETLPIS
jgi:hypothetical protein